MPFITSNNAIDASWTLGAEFDRSSYTILNKFPSSLVVTQGTGVRISILAPSNGGTLSATYISNVASSGNAYDADTTPTLITWNGSTSLTMVGQTEYTSDVVPFNFTVKPFIIGFNVGATTTTNQGYLPGVISYYHSALAEADNTTRTAAYSYNRNTIDFLTAIEIH